MRYGVDFLIMGLGVTIGIVLLLWAVKHSRESIDHLTGLWDNQYFLKWFQNQIDKGKKFHAVVVDIQQLKQINTLFGTDTGNQVLVETAKKLRELNHSGKVFRIGGRRLLAVMTTLSEYETLRNEIRRFFGTAFVADQKPVQVFPVICGIMDAQKLESRSDFLGYIEYLVSVTSNVSETVLIQSDEKTLQGFRYEKEIQYFLHTAIEKNLFEVYYQPVYSRETGTFVSMEALSRLHHPKLGPVSPELFIGIAEKSGQIEKIGDLQLHRICRFIKEHESIMETIRTVKVNLSPAELLRSGRGQQLMDVIRQYDLPFHYFQFEITETEATEYCETLYQTMSNFLSAGIELCLDDFGSGYANLNTVLRLPFSVIKLDRSLLNGVAEMPKIAAFYRNIVMVLRDMGFCVVSEGIETREEMEQVSRWGVDMIQGYYFSRPLPEKELLKLLENPGAMGR